MAPPLLTTKLYIPPPRPNLVSRPRLIERLNEGLRQGYRLILISAPAGFGKTTLLGEWIQGWGIRHQGPGIGDQESGGGSRKSGTYASRFPDTQSPIPNPQFAPGPLARARTGWLSLDDDDNDPVRFLTYLIAALEMAQPDVGGDVQALLQSPKPPPLKSILTALINNLATLPADVALGGDGQPGHERARPGWVLVLDDYHVIEEQAIHDALAFLLDHLPPGMHLVIASRVDPPLPLSRLRARGQMIDLRAADLRFTSEEVAAFLNQAMSLDLMAEHIAALASRTEGWIAGLQLAALSMQGRDNVSDFIDAFTGSQHYILDYLVEEVLQRQPEDVQSFLLQTSILERLCGPLCDAVVDEGQRIEDEPSSSFVVRHLPSQHGAGVLSDSQATLEHLEHANLFLVPLDDHREWYRYHHLFADFLRARLYQQVGEQGIAPLHRRASQWFVEHKLMTEAIDHALAAEDFEGAARLIEGAVEATLMRSEVATFLGWAEALPDEILRTRPRLRVYYAGMQLMHGRPLEVVEAQLREVMETDTTGSVSGELAVFQALIATYQRHTRKSAELAQRALELLPEKSLFLRSLVAGLLSLNALYSGDVVNARRALEEAARISQEAGNLMNTVLAVCHMAELSMLEGQLREAKALYEQALELAIDRQRRRQPIAGMAIMGLARLLYEWNDLQAAERRFLEGIDLIQQWGDPGAIQGYSGLARVLQARGNLEGAQQALHQARQRATRFDAMEVDDIAVEMYQVRLWVEQGNLEAGQRWAEERGLEGDVILGEAPLYPTLEYMTLAYLRIAQGRPADALRVVNRVLQVAEEAGWIWLVIELLALKTLAFQAQGDLTQAMTCLERALSLAEPQGMVLTFIEKGDSMADLLSQAAARGIAPDYVSNLLAAFGTRTKDEGQRTEIGESASVDRPWPLVERLSEREMEVLGLIAAGLSNREIAERLVIAVTTVKTHINNIYRKLDVSKRTQAVARARELNLL